MNDKQIITEAARKYGVSPKLLWGLYGTETSFGKNVSRSSAGAVGPFQFLPSTARGMGVNPYNFKSAAYGAARYLSQYKTRGTAGMLSAYNAGPGGGIQRSYVNTTLRNAQSYGNVPGAKIPGIEHTPSGNAVGPSAVAKLPGVSFDQAGFQKAQKGAILGKLISETEGASAKDNPLFATGLVSRRLPQRSEYEVAAKPEMRGNVFVPPNHLPDEQVATAGKGVYINPFKGFREGRTDQGIDYSGTPGQAIRAIGNAKILGVTPNWYKGQPYVYYELLDGPARGKVVYVAEQIAPSVRPGQRVARGQRIGVYARSGTALEAGFGTRSGATLARATTGYSEGQRTPAGQQFKRFLGGL